MVCLAGKSQNIRSYTVYIYGSGQPFSYSTFTEMSWVYGGLGCVHLVLAYPTLLCSLWSRLVRYGFVLVEADRLGLLVLLCTAFLWYSCRFDQKHELILVCFCIKSVWNIITVCFCIKIVCGISSQNKSQKRRTTCKKLVFFRNSLWELLLSTEGVIIYICIPVVNESK
jgi:hypothetical protein